MNPYHTFSNLMFSWVNAPANAVAEATLNCYNRPNAWSTRDEKGQAIPNHFLSTMPTLSFPYTDAPNALAPHRIVLWEPRNTPATTVCMLSSSGGPVDLATKTPFRWIGCVVDDCPPCPGYLFNYCQGNIRRNLAAIKEGRGWVFHALGPVQPFEDLECYKRRLVKDRLNRQIITEYMRRLGADIADDSFWQSDQPAYCMWEKDRPKLRPEEHSKWYMEGLKRHYEEKREQAIDSKPSQVLPPHGPEPLPVVTLEQFFHGGSEAIGWNLAEKHPGNTIFCSVLKAIRSQPNVQDVLVEMTEGDLSDPSAQLSSERVYVITSMTKKELQALLRSLRPDEIEKIQLDHLPGLPDPVREGYAVFDVWWD